MYASLMKIFSKPEFGIFIPNSGDPLSLLVMTEKPKEVWDKGKLNVAAVVNLLKARSVLNVAKLLLYTTYDDSLKVSHPYLLHR